MFSNSNPKLFPIKESIFYSNLFSYKNTHNCSYSATLNTSFKNSDLCSNQKTLIQTGYLGASYNHSTVETNSNTNLRTVKNTKRQTLS